MPRSKMRIHVLQFNDAGNNSLCPISDLRHILGIGTQHAWNFNRGYTKKSIR